MEGGRARSGAQSHQYGQGDAEAHRNQCTGGSWEMEVDGERWWRRAEEGAIHGRVPSGCEQQGLLLEEEGRQWNPLR